MNTPIYITRNGENFGPYSDEDARLHLASGTLSLSDLATREGDSEWQPLRQLLGIAAPPLTATSSAKKKPKPYGCGTLIGVLVFLAVLAFIVDAIDSQSPKEVQAAQSKASRAAFVKKQAENAGTYSLAESIIKDNLKSHYPVSFDQKSDSLNRFKNGYIGVSGEISFQDSKGMFQEGSYFAVFSLDNPKTKPFLFKLFTAMMCLH